MFRFCLVFAMAAAAMAEDVPMPAPGNIGGAEFPRIEAGGRVTFRLDAPEAEKVLLEGGEGLVAAPLEMARGDDGQWRATTEPAVPGFHYYWFTVDGLRVNDPASRTYFGWGRWTSGIEVPGGDSAFCEPAAVPQGDVRIRSYASAITGRRREVLIYTPPGYDREPETRYPVLYLLHGAGENQRGWFEQGRAGTIVDNLLAAEKAIPMIVVSDSGYASFPGAAGDRGAANAAFESVALRELIPFVDSEFRTLTSPADRALAGLSMGGGQTLRLALRHPETFAWIAAMSSPPRGEFEVATAFDGAFRDADAFHGRTRLLWIGAGTAETRFHDGARTMHEALAAAGIRSVFHSSPGTAHEWQTWRRGLHDLVPRLFRDAAAGE